MHVFLWIPLVSSLFFLLQCFIMATSFCVAPCLSICPHGKTGFFHSARWPKTSIDCPVFERLIWHWWLSQQSPIWKVDCYQDSSSVPNIIKVITARYGCHHHQQSPTIEHWKLAGGYNPSHYNHSRVCLKTKNMKPPTRKVWRVQRIVIPEEGTAKTISPTLGCWSIYENHHDKDLIFAGENDENPSSSCGSEASPP